MLCGWKRVFFIQLMKSSRKRSLGCAASLPLLAWQCFLVGELKAQQLLESYSPRPLAFAVCVDVSPTVDGDPAEPVYELAQPITDFNSRFLRVPPSQPTQARLIWNESGLFAAIRCFEEDIGEVVSIVTERDGPVEGDNCVGLTLTMSDDLSQFYSFSVNTLGTVADTYSADREWDGEWEAMVRRQRDSWTAEFYIPWQTLGRRPNADEVWGLGIQRVEGPHAEVSNWGVVDGNWGQRNRHGQIKFTFCRDLPYIEVDDPGRLVLGYNLLSGRLVRPASAEACYMIRFQRWHQPRAGLPREVDLANREITGVLPTFQFETSIEEPGKHLITFTLLSGSNVLYRTTLGYRVRDVERDRFALEPKQPTYTWEDEARFYLSVSPAVITPTMHLTTEIFKLTGRLAKVQEERLTGPHHVIRVPIRDLARGTYRVDISLKDGERFLASWSVMLDRRPFVPPPPYVQTRADGTIMIDDDSFYPLGLFEVPDIAEAAQSGFNVVVGRQAPDFSREQEMIFYLDRCKQLGLRAILTVESYLLPDPRREALREAVCRVKDHPALLGYLLPTRPSSMGIEPGYLETVRVLIRDVDPYHPLFLLEDMPVMFPGYSASCEVLLAGCNPVSHPPPILVRSVLERAWRAMHPVGSVLACLPTFEPAEADRHPSVRQPRAMAWTALISGARGILWSSCAQAKRAGRWGDLQEIAKELKLFLPFVIDGESTPIESFDSYPGVLLRRWRLEKDVLILAVNADTRPVAIPLPYRREDLQDLFSEGASIKAAETVDRSEIVFEPHGVTALIVPANSP